jgi:signal peptidase I
MILRRAATAVVIVVLLAALVSAVFLLSQHYHFFAVQTDSMAPTIRSGDLVIDAPPPTGGSFSVGQIITFQPTAKVVTTHRIHAIGENGIETKGDANTTPDVGTIQSNQVVGTVSFVIPYAGYVAVFLQQPLAWLSIVLVLVALFLLLQLRSTRDRSLSTPSPDGRMPE